MIRRPYEAPAISAAMPLAVPTAANNPTTLGEVWVGETQATGVFDLALLTVATTALDAIREALDDDSDATGVALYNPRQTIARLRDILKRADEQFATVKP